MKKDIVTKIKNIVGWSGAAILAFWALALLAVGNPISAVITLVLAFLVSPLRKKVFDKLHSHSSKYKSVFILLPHF